MAHQPFQLLFPSPPPPTFRSFPGKVSGVTHSLWTAAFVLAATAILVPVIE